jgi:hypothetical protein
MRGLVSLGLHPDCLAIQCLNSGVAAHEEMFWARGCAGAMWQNLPEKSLYCREFNAPV